MNQFKLQLIYIGNIPNDYHAKNLRIFFKIFIETEKFLIFHFRQRPEIINFNGNLENINLKPKRSQHATLCSFCVIKSCDVKQLLNYFNEKHWLSVNSETPISTKCRIILSDSFDNLSNELILKIIELQPPSNMPQGNVGTPFRYFFNANNNCKLPVTIIKKLGLDFNGEYKLNKYQSIPYNYEKRNDNQIYYHGGHSSMLMNDEEYNIYILLKDISAQNKNLHCFNNERGDSPDFTATQDDEMEEWERFEELHGDAHDMDKHGKCMLEYERKEEVTWEKGGPGMVLYTDQAFWRDHDPIDKDDFFDEPGNWDFDIDTADHLKEALYHQKILKKLDRQSNKKKNKRNQLNSDKNVPISDVAIRIMKKFGWNTGQTLGINIDRGIKSFTELFPSDYKQQYKDRVGVFCVADTDDSAQANINKNHYYGIDKNIRITYFTKFIKSSKSTKIE